ncbi:MAG: UDP-glucose 4-epimerase [Anaerocolumna sp.]|jgi:GDP-4-dehydro-6-deoxy-D-mannose reductase|nr:UDP-glucose 4-epimerase [Anaerocolumna sp.]
MRILVTGADGFVGRYLVQDLVKRQHHVIGGVLHSNVDLADANETVCFNITDNHEVDDVIDKLQPDGIIHLAAQSMVGTAWKNPAETLLINTIGTTNIVRSVSQFSRDTKVVTIGSSEEYGLTGKLGRALVEIDPCLPQNPYAISKFSAGLMAIQLALKDEINVVHARPFNHFGPHQRQGFVVSDFASQIAKIEQGLSAPIISVGDLGAQRDFTDVRDVIYAYILLLEQEVETGIYNICSGEPHTAREILDIMLSNTQVKIDVQIDKAKFRPSEVPLFIGSAGKLMQAVGWSPKRRFEDSIVETLNWWRNQ